MQIIKSYGVGIDATFELVMDRHCGTSRQEVNLKSRTVSQAKLAPNQKIQHKQQRWNEYGRVVSIRNSRLWHSEWAIFLRAPPKSPQHFSQTFSGNIPTNSNVWNVFIENELIWFLSYGQSYTITSDTFSEHVTNKIFSQIMGRCDATLGFNFVLSWIIYNANLNGYLRGISRKW